ncbi:MAG: hypothetical protein B6U94_05885 [Thermofilum sp. ex4484_79]|nr:MAG: hypothetical protein B6U94_05885 [Thermofilum sp. ex4484_79]
MYVRHSVEIENAEKKLLQALPFFLLNLLIPPLLLFLIQRYILLLVSYSLLCLISVLLLVTLRKTLEDYSLDDFMRLSKYIAILGFVTGLVVGGVLVLSARKYIGVILVKQK